MAELTKLERLQPSLLDRLTDDAPYQPQESREERVMNSVKLRDCVARDIGWLLNCTRHWADEDLEYYPGVGTSVLNYGIPDLAGTVLAGRDLVELQNLIRSALLHYEPRLIGSSLQVEVEADRGRMDSRSLGFRIHSEMWAQPMPLNLYLRTEVDLETGSFRIGEAYG